MAIIVVEVSEAVHNLKMMLVMITTGEKVDFKMNIVSQAMLR